MFIKKTVIYSLNLLIFSAIIFSQDNPSGAYIFNYGPFHFRSISCDIDSGNCDKGIYTYLDSIQTNEMREYRYFNGDYSWAYDFSNIKFLHIWQGNVFIPNDSRLQNGKVLTRACVQAELYEPDELKNAKLIIWPWDVDSPDEKDLIFFDGEIVRNLNGYDNLFYEDIFENIPLQFFDDRKLSVMVNIDIDHSSNYWALQMGRSDLSIDFVPKRIASSCNMTSKRNEFFGINYDIFYNPITTIENGSAEFMLETWEQRDQLCSPPNQYNCYRTLIRPIEENIFLNEPYFDYCEYASFDGCYYEIRWLPAYYEKLFYTTCYYTANENEKMYEKGHCQDKKHYTWCSGANPPSECYNNLFMENVMMQGSGQAKSGEIIQYLDKGHKKGCYYISDCPQTTSGQCAIKNKTIAVDKSKDPNNRKDEEPVIPWLGYVNANIPEAERELIAADTGKAIDGYKIDFYKGLVIKDSSGNYVSPCNGFPSGNKYVTFLKYQ